MKRIYKILKRTTLIVLLVLVMCDCSENKKLTQARVRIVQLMENTKAATITLKTKGNTLKKLTVSTGDATQYIVLPAGNYTIDVETNGDKILSKKIGLGSGGIYTLCFTGIVQDSSEVNEQTVFDKLHTLVEGAAAHLANGYYPKLVVLNDFHTANKKVRKLRVVNCLAGTTPLDITLKINQKNIPAVKDLKYSLDKTNKSLKSNVYEAEVTLGGHAVIKKDTLRLKNNEGLYTYFIFRKKNKIASILVYNK